MKFFNGKLTVNAHQDKNGWTIHYDAGGVGENWSEHFRHEFAVELHERLTKFDPKIPLHQNRAWTPRRKRLSIPMGEIVTQKKHVNPAILTLLQTVVDMGVYRKNNKETKR